jgi:hypothetical protein
MFSSALHHVLANGSQENLEYLSLRDVHRLVNARIRAVYGKEGIHAELHSPQQSQGEVADVRIFPNAAFRIARATADRQTAERTAALLVAKRQKEEDERRAQERAQEEQREIEAAQRERERQIHVGTMLEARREELTGRPAFDIKQEEAFRNAAERDHASSPINDALLKQWLEWKIWRSDGDVAFSEEEFKELIENRDYLQFLIDDWTKARSRIFDSRPLGKRDLDHADMIWITKLEPLYKELKAREAEVRAKQDELERHRITGTFCRNLLEADSFASIRSEFVNAQKAGLRRSFATVVQARIDHELLKYERKRFVWRVFTWAWRCLQIVVLIAVLIGLLYLCSRSG